MNRDEPLTPEERELARLLGRRAEQAPPPALDAAILAAARAAVDAPAAGTVASADAPRARQARPRWPAVFGIAASMVFAIGIAWQLRPEPPPIPAGEAQVAAAPAADDAVADQAAEGNAAETAMAPAPPAPEAAPIAAPAPALARAPVPAPAAPAEAPARASAKAEVAHARVVEPVADTAFAALPPPPPTAAPPVAYAAPAPAPAPASAPAPVGAMQARSAAPVAASTADAEPAPVLDRVQVTSSKRVTTNRSAPGVMRRSSEAGLSADTVQAEVDADARLPRRQWLQKIRERRDQDQRDLARASLERYIQQYPEARLPRDLRPLLDD
ncbi:hypothetical protein [Stenotrophomonas maltophilia]|uniref:Proline/alanine-rich repetetive membrane anchored protein n=1 Tax=Stenotrophomonas maltophilia TaxID=40324 RepID=A0A2W6IKY3_STEMA|nr:hypothetical protein [Stenotrophomonas maltophilia]PZS96140.1 hypothetical protein A7X83_21700 [Stenotrophomonas maltophilia]